MQGIIVHFRQNRHTVSSNHMIIQPSGILTRADATKLVGKKVVWNTGKRDLTGVVASAHGNSGCVRVIFETGMPGQSLSQKVQIN